MVYLGGLLRGGLRSHDQWLARKGIGRRSIEDLITAIGRLLGHGPLTRKELAENVHTELGRQAAVFVAHPWGDVVKRACARGVVCFGPGFLAWTNLMASQLGITRNLKPQTLWYER